MPFYTFPNCKNKTDSAGFVGQNKDLQASGQAFVATQALYAIVGALALQRGGDIAGSVVRERLLSSIDWLVEKTKDMRS